MRELNVQEVQEAAGGNPIVLGIVGGIIGNYIYESVGGAQGINNAFVGMIGNASGPSYLSGSGYPNLG